jgi:hypothetical protein
MAYTKRDNKDPMPTADNSMRGGLAGNTPVSGAKESHDQSKSQKISSKSNRTTGAVAEAVTQPDRQIGGNLPATGELHNQKKSQRITEDQRW